MGGRGLVNWKIAGVLCDRFFSDGANRLRALRVLDYAGRLEKIMYTVHVFAKFKALVINNC